MIFELWPETLAQDRLVATLEKQAAALRATHGLAIGVEFGAEPEVQLEGKAALYRIGQETLRNAARHARATHVEPCLAATQAGPVLEAVDNGIGFDAQESLSGHDGLRSLKAWIELFGGRVTIASAPGEGADIRAEYPSPPDGKN